MFLRGSLTVTLLSSFLATFAAAQDGESADSKPEPVPQPIAFSHKIHTQLGLECQVCHQTTETQSPAGLPQVSDCMICHRVIASDRPEIQKLSGYAEEGKPVPWERVYKVPYYVFFSHKNHRQAGFECSTCHGNVSERDVLWRESDISMDGCIVCHSRHSVSIECHLCHALDQ